MDIGADRLADELLSVGPVVAVDQRSCGIGVDAVLVAAGTGTGLVRYVTRVGPGFEEAAFGEPAESRLDGS